jgi:hypothetical protein
MVEEGQGEKAAGEQLLQKLTTRGMATEAVMGAD